jgi:DNA polymerase-3 subunit alpha
MSLFGAATGVAEEIHLPDVSDVDRREMLNWERELIGLYISDHPLTPYQPMLVKVVTHFSGQLPEAQHEEKVRVAGLITTIRPYQTKAGKPMGFMTLEDIQGNLELVLFPRTWEKHLGMLSVGQIVIVEGKVDAQSTPPKILVDAVKTEIKLTVPVGEEPAASIPAQAPEPLQARAGKPPRKGDTGPEPRPVIPPPIRQMAENPASFTTKWEQSGPPPPENFPEDWETEWQPSFEVAEIAARPEPPARSDSPIQPRDLSEPAEAESESSKPEPVEVPDEVRPGLRAGPLTPPEREPEPSGPPSIYIPVAQAQGDQDHPPKQITVTLRTTGDDERNKRRIKTIYGTLISYHGRDRFSLHVFENGRGHLIDFPNDTTRVCPEMLARLQKLMGEESWRIEEIRFQ